MGGILKTMADSHYTSGEDNYQNTFRNLVCNVNWSNCVSNWLGECHVCMKMKKLQSVLVVVFSWRNKGIWPLFTSVSVNNGSLFLICVNSLMQEVGCDHNLESGKRLDRCGVCAGDGSSCGLNIVNYTKIHLGYGKDRSLNSYYNKLALDRLNGELVYITIRVITEGNYMPTNNRFVKHSPTRLSRPVWRSSLFYGHEENLEWYYQRFIVCHNLIWRFK